MNAGHTMQDYVYDSTEQATTCCLGDVFFRKRRLAAARDYCAPTVKPKPPVDDNENDDTSGRLASSSERTLGGAAGQAVNLNSKYQASSDDNSRGARLAATTPDNDSYSRAVGQPWPGRQTGSLQESMTDLPPRYTPTPDEDRQTAGAVDPGAWSRARNPQRQKPRSVSAGRLAKEHEMLQNMWLDHHGGRRRQDGDQARRVSRRSSSVGSSGRTVFVTDRSTKTKYRRGRLLGKVSDFIDPVNIIFRILGRFKNSECVPV